MIFPGHIGAAYLAARAAGVPFAMALPAALFPDVSDKAGRLLGLSPSGRLPAHSLLTAALLVPLVGRLAGRRAARAWMAGYVAHVAGDILADMANGSFDFRYVVWPLLGRPARRHRSLWESLLAYRPAALLLELAIAGAALALAAGNNVNCQENVR